ncbi:MAG: EAL domain-containing protein [Pseudolabrys sp.]
MIVGLRNLFSPGPAPFADPQAPIPLGQVLARDWFELWYQPKIELKTLHMIGVEGRVCARHPQRGAVPAELFLPGASEADLLALAERAILTALHDWELFAAYGVAMKFAVGIPACALRRLPIAKILRKSRPRAANWPGMILEVSEQETVDDLALATDAAAALRELKCTLALAKVGADIDALAQLPQLPYGEIKIQRDYVAGCDVNASNRRRCESIVEFARRCGVATVADGIESARESHRLQAIGCRAGQGELFGNPMPKGRLIGLMRSRMVGNLAAGRA